MQRASLVVLLLAAFAVAVNAWDISFTVGSPFPNKLFTSVTFNDQSFPTSGGYFNLFIGIMDTAGSAGDDLEFSLPLPNGWTGPYYSGAWYTLPYNGFNYVPKYTWVSPPPNGWTYNQLQQVLLNAYVKTAPANRLRGVWIAVEGAGANYYSWLYPGGVQWLGASQCGNGILESGEQCDNPGAPCCSSTCQFSNAGTVCRPAVGDCDVAEVCSGSSDTCPQDSFASSTKVCGEMIGFCDVRVPNTCTGTSPYCRGVPYLQLDDSTFNYQASWENFNVISFGDFASASGEVEGRLAVRGNADLGAFSLGGGLDTTPSGHDRHLPYSLVVGGDASWGSGSIWPDGSVSHPSAAENALIFGTFSADQYLFDRKMNSTLSAGDALGRFDTAKTFYTGLQDKLAATASNAPVTPQWGGLRVDCSANPSASSYYLNVAAADLAASTWWNLESCNFQAFFIINIQGTGAASVQGGDFPAITERVIYNVLGSGRTFSSSSGLRGNVLAPRNTFSQTTGVTRGLIIAGNIPTLLHAQNPNCIKFDPVTITVKTNNAVQGSKKRGTGYVPVYSVGGLSEGDEIDFGGETTTVTGAVQQGNQIYLIVDPALSNDYPAGTFFTTTVADPITADRPGMQVQQPTSNPEDSSKDNGHLDSAATSVVASLAVIFALIAALLF